MTTRRCSKHQLSDIIGLNVLFSFAPVLERSNPWVFEGRGEIQ